MPWRQSGRRSRGRGWIYGAANPNGDRTHKMLGWTPVTPISSLAVLAVSSVTAAGSGADKGACAPSGSQVLAGGREARAYETREGFLAGCRFETGRERILVERGWLPAPAVDIAGTVVGSVSVDTDGVGVGPPTLVLEDLARPLPPPALRRFEIGAVGILRITRRGGVAWIECEDDAERAAIIPPSCRRRGSFKRVFKRDPLGAGPDTNVLLDEGRGIPIGSLQLRGRRVTWQKRGRHRSAAFR